MPFQKLQKAKCRKLVFAVAPRGGGEQEDGQPGTVDDGHG